jgi:hypothetical protein
MKESYGKDPASHPDPESCVGGRKVAGEALTGAHAGQPLSSEITLTGVPTSYGEGKGNTTDGAIREPAANAAEVGSRSTGEAAEQGCARGTCGGGGGKAIGQGEHDADDRNPDTEPAGCADRFGSCARSRVPDARFDANHPR